MRVYAENIAQKAQLDVEQVQNQTLNDLKSLLQMYINLQTGAQTSEEKSQAQYFIDIINNTISQLEGTASAGTS
jgi:hypothetical protein